MLDVDIYTYVDCLYINNRRVDYYNKPDTKQRGESSSAQKMALLPHPHLEPHTSLVALAIHTSPISIHIRTSHNQPATAAPAILINTRLIITLNSTSRLWGGGIYAIRRLLLEADASFSKGIWKYLGILNVLIGKRESNQRV